MANNINYQIKLQNELELIKNSGQKPSLLLHVCCGPCSTVPLKELYPYFKITIIYNNSNIYPKEEYLRRLAELKQYILDEQYDINIIECEYDNITYNIDLEPYKEMPEGHERCRICFRKRFEFGFQYALTHHFDYYGTVMTISRYKNAQDINRIGEELSNKYQPVKWLYADFKKNNGYEDSLIVIKDRHMYFQEYCGCLYSYQKYLQKKQKSGTK